MLCCGAGGIACLGPMCPMMPPEALAAETENEQPLVTPCR